VGIYMFFFDKWILITPLVSSSSSLRIVLVQGRIQDFKLGEGGGGAFKNIAPSGGRRENFWGISCEKNLIFSNFRRGAPDASPGSAPACATFVSPVGIV
jgi:hypothetical protein